MLVSCTIRSVSIGPESVHLSVETDIMLATAPVHIPVTLERRELLNWQADNSGKTVDDYILMKIQTVYNLYAKLAQKAATLKDKVVTW
jgi:hypothetical protein